MKVSRIMLRWIGADMSFVRLLFTCLFFMIFRNLQDNLCMLLREHGMEYFTSLAKCVTS